MTTDNCSRHVEWLVDYADGELTDDERRRLEVHVIECARCRELLASLERSLELATDVWDSAARDASDADGETVGLPAPPSAGRRKWRAVATAVSIVLVLAATVLLTVAVRGPSPRPSQRAPMRHQVARTTTVPPTTRGAVDELPDEHDAERMLQEHELAARLSAAARMVKEITADADVESQARDYLDRYYSETKKGRLN